MNQSFNSLLHIKKLEHNRDGRWLVFLSPMRIDRIERQLSLKGELLQCGIRHLCFALTASNGALHDQKRVDGVAYMIYAHIYVYTYIHTYMC